MLLVFHCVWLKNLLKTEYQQQSFLKKMPIFGVFIKYDCCWYYIINGFFNHKQWNTNNSCNQYLQLLLVYLYYGVYVPLHVHITLITSYILYSHLEEVKFWKENHLLKLLYLKFEDFYFVRNMNSSGAVILLVCVVVCGQGQCVRY